MNKIKVLGDKVLVEVDTQTKTMSGLEVVQSDDARSFKGGKVVAVGPGKFVQNVREMSIVKPEFESMTVKVGDKVLFNFGQEVTIEGKSYMVMAESDICVILE